MTISTTQESNATSSRHLTPQNEDINDPTVVTIGSTTEMEPELVGRVVDNTESVRHDTPPEAVDLPKEFYCPITNERFQDPIVAKDGETYEKSAYLKRQKSEDCKEQIKLYPNRALRAIMDDAILRQSGSIQSNLQRLHFQTQQAVWEILDGSESALGPQVSYPLSDGFYCPITYNIVHDPVIDPEGNTYEKVAAGNWIRVNGTSPVTRSPLAAEELYPNHIIRRLLDNERGKTEDEMHPEIRRWKDEPAPKSTDIEHGGALVATSNSSQYPNGSPSDILRTNGLTTTLPSTQMQRYRRRLARRRVILNAVGILFCVLSVVGLMLLGRSFFLLMFMMTLIIIFSKKRPVSR